MALSHPPYDLVIIGGGINGAGIAADAAGRGLSVLLCEQHDLASHTSSASSKLVHGGLRYLEQHEFRLVREALGEREILLARAPHLVRPLRFILPWRPHLRPAWLIRLGLFLYDHLARRSQLPGSQRIQPGPDSPLQPDIHQAFAYSDCAVDDARLVVANAMAAREQGARIWTRTRCNQAWRADGLWQVRLEHQGQPLRVRARALVNATGPWAARFIEDALGEHSPCPLRLVRGSHLVLPRLYPGQQAYILQNPDRRVVFVIPWLEQFSLIGTTDCDYSGDPAKVQISEAEITYLLDSVNRYFRRPVRPANIRHSYAGVRPLFDDGSGNPSATTRDYHLALSETDGQPPLLSIFGGKLTTYRRLAEAALHRLHPHFPQMGPDWTAHQPLPGGEQLDCPEQLARQLLEQHPWLPAELASHWASHYGQRCWLLLQDARCLADLGEPLGGLLYAREVDYLRSHEWACTAGDILWRRTRLGLFLPPGQTRQLQAWLDRHPHPGTP